MTRPSPRRALLAWLILLAMLAVPDALVPGKPQGRDHPAVLPGQPLAVNILQVNALPSLHPTPFPPPATTVLPELSGSAPVLVTSFKPIISPLPLVAEALLFSHASDYTWLVGQLEYVYVRDTWKLHYAG